MWTAAAYGVSGINQFGSVAELPYWQASGAAVSGQTGTSDLTLQNVQSTTSGQAITGVLGSSSVILQLPSASGTGYEPSIGTSSVMLLPVQAISSGIVAPGGTYSVIAMHTERQAITQYQGFEFNSFFTFNGKYYGIGSAGMCEITGKNDNGTPIAATVSGGITDFGASFLKTVDRAYAGYRTSGQLNMSLTVDGGKQYAYTLGSTTGTTGKSGMFGRRAIFGRGLRSRYYQWTISNVNGADFALDSVELETQQLSRRIGGSDA
jgi:hypothetical protein